MVKYISKVNSAFEDLYLQVRRLEHRVYTDEEVSLLPYVSENHLHHNEWKIRQSSCNRFIQYVQKRNPGRVLEVGCGNGWFSYQIACKVSGTVTGVDVNVEELEQAARVFSKKSLQFVYANIFDDAFSDYQFDCVVFNSSIQYFPNMTMVLNRIDELLVDRGELHILDSPFYDEDELTSARERSEDYYKRLNCQDMIDHYFHHAIDELAEFEVLYYPKSWKRKWLRRQESPFKWFKKVKHGTLVTSA